MDRNTTHSPSSIYCTATSFDLMCVIMSNCTERIYTENGYRDVGDMQYVGKVNFKMPNDFVKEVTHALGLPIKPGTE
jgi:hypothetical protein